MTPQARAPVWLTPLAFNSMVVLLGVNYPAVRISNRELAPLWGCALRFVLASAILGAVVLIRRIPMPRGRLLLRVAAVGVLRFSVAFGLLNWVLVRIPAGLSSIVYATAPLLTVLFGAALGLAPFRARPLLGALLAFGGILILLADRVSGALPTDCVVALFIGAAALSLSTIATKELRSGPLVVNSVGMAAGAAILLVVSPLWHERPSLPVQLDTHLALAWLVGSTVVTSMLLVWILRRWTAASTSYFSVLTPIVASTSAVFLAGERVSRSLVIGGIVVLLGVMIGIQERRA